MALTLQLNVKDHGSIAKLKRVTNGFDKMRGTVAQKTAEAVRDRAIRNVLDRRKFHAEGPQSGRAIRGFRIQKRRGEDRLLVNKEPVAAWLEFGTSPHPITPKGKALKISRRGGETFYASEVRHPGAGNATIDIPPSPLVGRFVRDAVNMVMAEGRHVRIAESEVKKLLRG